MTTPNKPRCTALRMGGPEHDWRDVPCPDTATTEFDGRPVCAGHRANLEANEQSRLAEDGFFLGVPAGRLRELHAAGGLAPVLAELDRVNAENAALREDAGRMLAALEAQGQESFIAGLRTKAGKGVDDGLLDSL